MRSKEPLKNTFFIFLKALNIILSGFFACIYGQLLITRLSTECFKKSSRYRNRPIQAVILDRMPQGVLI
jgi:hypothetical protein